MYYINNWLKMCLNFCILVVLILSIDFFISWYDYYYLIGNLLLNNVGVFNIMYLLSIDNISVVFLIITALLLFISMVINWYNIYKENLLNGVILIILLILLNVFLVNDLMYFFMFFEALVIPMFILIGIWGSRTRRMKAAYLLLMYTLLGSLFTLLGFLYISQCFGSTNFIFLTGLQLNVMNQNLLFLLCFIGFSVKIPIVPLHLWLPEAHVEAPTMGSILLAGILLKLSFYAFMRLLFLFLDGWFLLMVYTIFFIGFLVPSLAAFVQLDIKKIIAYSSVSHMNFGLFGLFSKTFIGFMGCFYLMIGHAIVASALFFLVGILYDRYKTRILLYYGGLFLIMPLWTFFFFLAILANFGLPGTINFVGEFMVLISIFKINFLILIFLFIGLVATLGYSLFLYNRLAHGFLKNKFIRYFSDITRKDFYGAFILIFLTYLFGIRPQLLIQYIITVSYYLWILC